MSEFKQRQTAWSPEDQATYVKWRSWMLIIFGTVVVAIAIYAVVMSPAPDANTIATTLTQP
jgi:hypothetical protein